MSQSHDKLRLRIAKELRSINELSGSLEAEVEYHFNAKDIMGGPAMVLLGPVADPEAWSFRQMSSHIGRTGPHGLDEMIGDLKPPLLVLTYWEYQIRTALGTTNNHVLNRGGTGYIGSAVDWMLDTDDEGNVNFPQVEQLARDLRKCRKELERVLKAGDQIDQIKAECKNCDKAPRLRLIHGDKADGSKDFWQCPNKACAHMYDQSGVARCWRTMLVKRGDPPEWLTIAAAANALARSPRTIRTWIRMVNEYGMDVRPKVESTYDDAGTVLVRWSDVRAADDTTRRRGKYRSVA